MKTRIALALAILGGALLWGVLVSTEDLRGWPPGEPLSDRSLLKATQTDRDDFLLGACMPSSIRPYSAPREEEFHGTATETVLACRSKESAARWIGLYAAFAGVCLLVLWNRSRKNGDKGVPCQKSP